MSHNKISKDSIFFYGFKYRTIFFVNIENKTKCWDLKIAFFHHFCKDFEVNYTIQCAQDKD